MSARIRCIVIALLILSSLLGGGRAPQAASPRQVVVWTGMTDTEQATLIAIGSDYQKATGVPVVVQNVPFADLRLKFQIAAPAGLGPDLITGPHDWTGLLATANLIQPLSAQDFPPDMQAQFQSAGLKAMTFQQRLYGFPYTLEAGALIYNEALLPRIPATFQELLPIAQQLTHGDQHGLLFEIDNFYVVWPFFSGYGATVFPVTPGGGLDYAHIALDSPAAVITVKN